MQMMAQDLALLADVDFVSEDEFKKWLSGRLSLWAS